VPESTSCLAGKFSYYIDLTDADRKIIAALERDEIDYDRRTLIRDECEAPENLYVVKHGWLYTHTELEDGRRHIHDIHFPGDGCAAALTSITGVTLCPFPKSALDDVMSASPRLTALLYSFAMLDATVIFDRLRAVARMDAKERLAHLLLQIYCRLRITDREMAPRFELPLTQEVIADAIGLSPVHVNRTLRELEEGGFIAREGREMIILRDNDLRDMCEFRDRFYRIDTSWFPEARS